MKNIKCPVCEEKLDQFNILRDGTLVEVGCHKCKWSTHPNSPEGAWKEVEEFISKFPPIMRVHKKDKVILTNGILYEVVDIDRRNLALTVRSEKWKPVLEIWDAQIIKWPWEIKKKGGK